MRDDYLKSYRDLYERHWWWRAREKLILKTLKGLRPAGGWNTILDVGCGDGLFFDQLSLLGDVEGVEPSAPVRKDSPHRSRIHTSPFDEHFAPGKKYGLILMLDVLEHLHDPAFALRHAMDLLAPTGTLFVTVPAFKILWGNHDVLNRHVTRFTRRTFQRLARQARFEIQGERYFFQWLFPLKLAVRGLEHVLSLQPKPPRLPPTPVNTFCYGLSRVEQSTWGALGFPFGSSLMVWGRKSRCP